MNQRGNKAVSEQRLRKVVVPVLKEEVVVTAEEDRAVERVDAQPHNQAQEDRTDKGFIILRKENGISENVVI